MKTKEELNALKQEVEALNKKLAELSEDELKQVSGGAYAAYANDGNCGHSVILQNGRCKSLTLVIDPEVGNPCVRCKYN